MNEINNRVLSSLALIHSNIIKKDYVSTFVPFIATIIKNKAYENIDIGIVCEDFGDEYGFTIPRAPMTTILSRCVQEGLVVRGKNGIYLPVSAKIRSRAFSGNQQESTRAYVVVINRFIEFAQGKPYEQAYTFEEAESIFLAFLEKYSQKSITNSPILDDETAFEDNGNGGKSENKNLFIIARYIQYCYQSELELFSRIQQLSLAHIVASALAYDVEPDKKIEEFNEVTIYLDTPLVLRLLGLQTDEMQNATQEMFTIFNETISPRYMLFAHTLIEITGILQDCVHWIENPQYDPRIASTATTAFIKKKYNKIQIDLFIATLQQLLFNQYGIEVDDQSYSAGVFHQFQIDEKVFRQKFIEISKARNPNLPINERSVDFDVQSISSIFKMRGGRSLRSYSTAKYLFLTTNSRLAYVSRKYVRDYSSRGNSKTAPCLTEYFLGTMVWLGTPIAKLEQYNQAKLLANCCAATTPSAELIEKYVDSYERLRTSGRIGENDYYLLRAQAFETNYLENHTLNEEEAYSDKITEEILEDIKSEIVAPYLEKAKEQEETIAQLANYKEQNEQQKENARKARERLSIQAEKAVNSLANWLVAIPVAFIAFLVTIITNIVPLIPPVKVLLIIFSATLVFLSTIFQLIMRTNCKDVKKKIMDRKYKKLLFKKHYFTMLPHDLQENV